MYLLHEVIISLYNVMGIVLRLNNFNYMLENNILNNYLQKIGFLRVWASKWRPDTLLAKIMLQRKSVIPGGKL